jgi:hypothetical protein
MEFSLRLFDELRYAGWGLLTKTLARVCYEHMNGTGARAGGASDGAGGLILLRAGWDRGSRKVGLPSGSLTGEKLVFGDGVRSVQIFPLAMPNQPFLA